MRRAAHVLFLLLFCSPARAGDGGDLPIRAGRWSSAGCSRRGEADTRFFEPGWTSTLTARCAMSARRAPDGTFRAHLACAHDEDDVVLKVSSPTSLTWINQCTTVEYRFCR